MQVYIQVQLYVRVSRRDHNFDTFYVTKLKLSIILTHTYTFDFVIMLLLWLIPKRGQGSECIVGARDQTVEQVIFDTFTFLLQLITLKNLLLQSLNFV